MSNLLNLLQRLAGASVDFVIVGGYAGVIHGCTYLTQDVDIDTNIGHLDCLGEIQGIGGYAQVREASEPIEVEGVQLRVLAMDALIAAKQAMNRPRDREAIRQLKVIQKLRHGF